MNRIHDRGTKREAWSIDRLPPDDLCILVLKIYSGDSLGSCRKRKLKSVDKTVSSLSDKTAFFSSYLKEKEKLLAPRSSTAHWGSQKRGSPPTAKLWESMRTWVKRSETTRERRRREQRQGSPHEVRVERRRAGLIPVLAVPRPSRPCSGSRIP